MPGLIGGTTVVVFYLVYSQSRFGTLPLGLVYYRLQQALLLYLSSEEKSCFSKVLDFGLLGLIGLKKKTDEESATRFLTSTVPGPGCCLSYGAEC